MTSATGSARRPRLSQSSFSRRVCSSDGFTLLELMIVIFIMMLLMGIFVTAAVGYKRMAYKKKAEAMIQGLQIAIDEFRNINGMYPSDGMDSSFETEDTATELQSGAALAYQLSRPVKRPIQQPDGSIHWQVADPVAEFKQEDLVKPDEDLGDVYELIDPWGSPIHYDRLANGARDYSRQETEECHFKELGGGEVHQGDPREEEGIAVEVAGPQNLRKYDLWMHGPGGHTAEEDPSEVVCNWVLPEDDG